MAEKSWLEVKTGAYWMQIAGGEPDLCWLHKGKITFLPQLPKDQTTVRYYLDAGAVFTPIAPPKPIENNPEDNQKVV